MIYLRVSFYFLLSFSVGQPNNDCIGPADIVIVVDGSSSITFLDESNWPKLINFVSRLSQTFPLDRDKGTHVGLIQFATEPRVEFNLNTYFTAREIMEYLNQMSQVEGETNIAYALNMMTNDVFGIGRAGDRSDIKNLAIVITDGTHNAEGWNVENEAKLAKAEGIEIFAVGVESRPPPDSYDLRELQIIASRTDYVFTARDFDDLDNVIDRLTGPLCDTAGYITTTPAAPTLPPTTLKPIGKVCMYATSKYARTFYKLTNCNVAQTT